jgi:hypothetical protein
VRPFPLLSLARPLTHTVRTCPRTNTHTHTHACSDSMVHYIPFVSCKEKRISSGFFLLLSVAFVAFCQRCCFPFAAVDGIVSVAEGGDACVRWTPLLLLFLLLSGAAAAIRNSHSHTPASDADSRLPSSFSAVLYFARFACWLSSSLPSTPKQLKSVER